MTIQHNTITDPDIHEPKGAASAASGKVYVADGAGSGAWSYPLTGLDTALTGQVFQSNGSGNGTWVYPPAKAHAEIYMTTGTTTHTLSAGSAYTLLNPGTEWTAGDTSVLTSTPSNGTITLVQAGTYYIDFWINFTTAAIASGSAYNFKYALNGSVGTRKSVVTKPTNGADKLTLASSGLVTATAGQTVSIFVAGDGTSSTTNITPTECGLTALYLG
jgi:hypothetical protein